VSRDWTSYPSDMIESCRRVVEYTRGMERGTFLSDWRTCDTTIRNLEILGEVVKQVPARVQAQYPDVPWRKVAGLRDVLAHVYFGIDEDLLWDVVSNRVPAMLAQLETIPLHPGSGDE
jgi:uncharacterized protein with HEPN domain